MLQRTVELLVGAYSRISALPPCGLAGRNSILGVPDAPDVFYSPEHLEAQLLWFGSGFVEYVLDPEIPHGCALSRVEVAAELCSEAPHHRNEFPSDILVALNDIEIATWTSPGDFGGRRGRFTPAYWDLQDTQFGLWKRWSVTRSGSYLDDVLSGAVTIATLGNMASISIRFEVKRSAQYCGGINLFGRGFGDFESGIVVTLDYDDGFVG